MDKFRIDGEKMSLHPHRVVQWKDSGDDWEKAKKVYQVYVEISPVGACNHRCTFCAVDYIGYKTVSLDESRLRWTMVEMANLGVKSIMLAGEGEPLLHKQINRIINWRDHRIDMAITTNGILLDRAEDITTLSWIKVSVNAGTEDTYRKVHKAHDKDWGRLWTNIKDAAKRKGTCTLGVQMVCLPENAGEEKELQARCDDAGVDYLVFKPYSQHKMSITKQYEGYKPIALPSGAKTIPRVEAIKTEGHAYDKCNATPFMWAYLMANGDLYSCSAYLLDDRFNLGNLNTLSFMDVWEGEKRKANWQFVRKELDIHECRVNCRMDKVNRYLWGLDHQEHASFI